MRLIPGNDVFDLYGRWDALAAFNSAGEHIGTVRAHDGDFFPESILDYVEALRSATGSGATGDGPRLWPLRVDIDVTQACNANCTFCFSRPYQNKEYRGQWAKEGDIETVIADLAARGTRTVRFCGGGEPLVHPQSRRLLQMPSRYGMRSCLITSGDLLDDSLVEIIFDHVDHLRWSVNAANDDTRARIHRPKNGANLLSESFRLVKRLMKRRTTERGVERRPMVWATFLVVPENVDEIVKATEMLRDAGVDSISFRPVYHGLISPWTADGLVNLEQSLIRAATFAVAPHFSVFAPGRFSGELRLPPSGEFLECLSRQMRTVLEATAVGMTLQSCGMYRGSGAHAGLVVPATPFAAAWERSRQSLPPVHAPAECEDCIDRSMNVTLEFINRVLRFDHMASFSRACASPEELMPRSLWPQGPQDKIVNNRLVLPRPYAGQN